MEDLISVVVPIYNVETYLSECIDSIVNQTYKNLEIILVDDGSPDNCPQICDDYAKKDHRIKVIHKKNGGLSSARNAGLDICKGKYIAFIDSDDFIKNNHLSNLYESIIKYGADIACSGFVDYYMDSGVEIIRCPNKKYKIFNQIQALNNYYNKYCAQITVAWNKLYSVSMFDNLRYDKMIYEDSNILIPMLSKINKIVVVPFATYHYRKRSQSLVGGNINESRFNSLVTLCLNRISNIKKYFPSYLSKEVALRLTDIGSAYKHCSNVELKEKLKNLFNYYWFNYKKYLKFKYPRTLKCYYYRFLIKKR